MDKHEKSLLEHIYTAQVLILTAQIKREKKDRGVSSTSDFISDAIKLINQKKDYILRTH